MDAASLTDTDGVFLSTVCPVLGILSATLLFSAPMSAVLRARRSFSARELSAGALGMAYHMAYSSSRSRYHRYGTPVWNSILLLHVSHCRDPYPGQQACRRFPAFGMAAPQP